LPCRPAWRAAPCRLAQQEVLQFNLSTLNHPNKKYLNSKCRNWYACYIRSGHSILLTFTRLSITYFKTINFKVDYVIILISHVGLSLNGYLSRIIPIKHYLNFECHENCHAHCIRCKDPILISCKQSSATYFELHNFKVGYVLFLYPT
jgi:hypothetical protein